MSVIDGVAKAILDGFNRHYTLFRQYSLEGKACFEQANWVRTAEVSKQRIQGYEERVSETVYYLHKHFPEAGL